MAHGTTDPNGGYESGFNLPAWLLPVLITGFISFAGSAWFFGGKTQQVDINTGAIADIRSSLKTIEEIGSPPLQEVRKRLEVDELALARLPLTDEQTKGRIAAAEDNIRRLDALVVKKTDDWPPFVERMAKVEASILEMGARLTRTAEQLNEHLKRDDNIEQERIRALQTELNAERATRPH